MASKQSKISKSKGKLQIFDVSKTRSQTIARFNPQKNIVPRETCDTWSTIVATSNTQSTLKKSIEKI